MVLGCTTDYIIVLQCTSDYIIVLGCTTDYIIVLEYNTDYIIITRLGLQCQTPVWFQSKTNMHFKKIFCSESFGTKTNINFNNVLGRSKKILVWKNVGLEKLCL